MPESITEPMTPEVDNPKPFGPLSGDWKDDDAEVYQDDFEAADHGPVEATGVPHSKPELRPVGRLLSRQVIVGSTAGGGSPLLDPVMVFPADRNRDKVTVQLWSNSEYSVTIADSKSGCYNGNSFMSGPTFTSIDLDGYTGALWVYCNDPAADGDRVTVSVVAVTE